MPITPIPTFASGTISVCSGSDVLDILQDSAKAGSADGYQNQFPTYTVGSYNGWFNNEVLTSRAPVAGVNGNQS